MRSFLLLCMACFVLVACKSGSDGEVSFKSVYNVQLKGLNKKRGELSALVVLDNSFVDKDFKVKEVNLDILIDGIDVGTYYSTKTLQVKAQSELKIPVEYAIDNQKIQNSEGEYSSIFVVKFDGEIVLTDAQGKEQTVDIKHQESVNPIVSKKEKKSKTEVEESEEDKMTRKEKRELNQQVRKERLEKIKDKREK